MGVVGFLRGFLCGFLRAVLCDVGVHIVHTLAPLVRPRAPLAALAHAVRFPGPAPSAPGALPSSCTRRVPGRGRTHALMPSIIKFTALAGALTGGPLCYLLDLEGYRILLDCGWSEPYDPELHAPLRRYGPRVHAPAAHAQRLRQRVPRPQAMPARHAKQRRAIRERGAAVASRPRPPRRAALRVRVAGARVPGVRDAACVQHGPGNVRQ